MTGNEWRVDGLERAMGALFYFREWVQGAGRGGRMGCLALGCGVYRALIRKGG